MYFYYFSLLREIRYLPHLSVTTTASSWTSHQTSDTSLRSRVKTLNPPQIWTLNRWLLNPKPSMQPGGRVLCPLNRDAECL